MLHDVSFEVPAGRTVALVGPTGSGKSTIAALAARLVDPADGAVELDGVDVARADRGQPGRDGRAGAAGAVRLRRHRARQRRARPGRRRRRERCRPALRLAQADGFVDRLPDGLDTMVGERGTSLSGGQRQRLTLARALAGRPRLLVLDDATSAVDPRVEAAILAGLRPGRRVDPGRRLPAGHHRARRRGGLPRARPGGRARHARASCWPPCPGTPTWSPPTSGPTPSAPPSWTRDAAIGRLSSTPHAESRDAAAPAGAPTSTTRGGAHDRPSCRRERGGRVRLAARMRRGLALSPELRVGLAGTLALALVAMVGRVAVPVAIQQIIDRGPARARRPAGRLRGRGRPGHAGRARASTAVCSYLMMRRLFTVSETALASVRTRTFRHIHDLSMLHQQSERRGALTSRVTSDIDQITQFLQWGGVMLLVSAGQIVVTTVVMAVYSWQLTLVVLRRVPPARRRDPALPAPAGRGLRRGPRPGRRAARRGQRERRRRRGDPGVRGRPAGPRRGWTTRSSGTGRPSSGRCARP